MKAKIKLVKKITSATSPEATANYVQVGEDTINKRLKYKFLDYKQVDDHDVFFFQGKKQII